MGARFLWLCDSWIITVQTNQPNIHKTAIPFRWRLRRFTNSISHFDSRGGKIGQVHHSVRVFADSNLLSQHQHLPQPGNLVLWQGHLACGSGSPELRNNKTLHMFFWVPRASNDSQHTMNNQSSASLTGTRLPQMCQKSQLDCLCDCSHISIWQTNVNKT